MATSKEKHAGAIAQIRALDRNEYSGGDEYADAGVSGSGSEGMDSSDIERFTKAAIEQELGDTIKTAEDVKRRFDETQVEIAGIDRRVFGVEDEALLPQDEATNEDLDQRHTFDWPHESFTVAVEVGNDPDYIGLTASTGCVRIGQVDGVDGLDKSQAVAGDGYVTLYHHDTSALTGNYGNMTGSYPPYTCITGMTVDTYGHVTAINSFAIEDYFYTESEIDTKLGALTYLGLDDTDDATYTAKVGYVPMVNDDADGLVLTSAYGLLIKAGYAQVTVFAPVASGGPVHRLTLWGNDNGEA